MSEYLVLIYDGTSWENATEQDSARVMSGHGAFAEHNGPALRGGQALQFPSTATTLHRDGPDGFSVTDGPYGETKEALGGFYVIEAADLDAAIEIAKQIPVIAGALEIRPIMVFN